MMTERHDPSPRSRLEPSEPAETILKQSLDRAERAYDRVLVSLWLGNGVGALATLAYATANRHDGTFTRSLLVPLVLFVFGLAVTGVGSLIELELERRWIASAAREREPHDRSPAAAWLLRRTITALISGACFSIAFIFGFAMLARN
jgi:uncharacterized membrane protein (Fun14 family)